MQNPDKPPSRQLPLSVHRSFVVSLRSDLELDVDNVAGRIEHVVSGEASEFRSAAGMLDFVRRVLASSRSELDEEAADDANRH